VMIWKVCGMRESENIEEVLKVQPDWMGLIFYPGSKRYVSALDENTLKIIWSSSTTLVGVFVNASYEVIKEAVAKYQLKIIQLHGHESSDLGNQLKKNGLQVMKVFGVENELPEEDMKSWEGIADFFLFDTKSVDYGGAGRQFNWNALSSYKLDTPFLIGGGVGLDNIRNIDKLKLEKLVGIDTNSKLEITPGVKDLEKVKKMKEAIC